ncbi:hypothetical protein L6164_026308 [Bauhinia variegata]|uniref:Uncharacterized protein n=1 Tax=Bauhinia variegata TaxID=167791 RepID=A0ACB9LPQ2_BAUVA|nr:hypothetical protein L6164_026308 [Bauhinia variegata]
MLSPSLRRFSPSLPTVVVGSVPSSCALFLPGLLTFAVVLAHCFVLIVSCSASLYMAMNSELGFDVPEGVPVTGATSDEMTSPVTVARPRTVHELDDVRATYAPGVLDMDDLRSNKAPTTSDLKEAWWVTKDIRDSGSVLTEDNIGSIRDSLFGTSGATNGFDIRASSSWSGLVKEVGYLYFSAKRGRSLILPAEDSTKQFKQWFFRVVEPDVGRPFFIDDNGKAKFPLRWRKNFGRVEEITTVDLGHAALYLVKELEARVYSDPAKAFYRAARYIDRKTMPNLKALLARTGCDLSGVLKKRKASASSARPEVEGVAVVKKKKPKDVSTSSSRESPIDLESANVEAACPPLVRKGSKKKAPARPSRPEGPVVDIPPMMGDPNLNEGGDLHFATEPMMGEENLPEGGDLPFAVGPQERVNPSVGGAHTASGRSDTGLNPENLLQEYEHVQSTVMLSQVANSFANQVRLIKEQTGGLRRSLNMIQIVHDQIKSDQHASIKADEMCAMKEAAEEKIAVADKRIAALEAELASAKGIAADTEKKIKSVEEKASRAVSQWAELGTRVQDLEKELSASRKEALEWKTSAKSSEKKLEKALTDIKALENDLSTCQSSSAGKSERIRFLEERVTASKASADKRIAEVEEIAKKQTELTRQRRHQIDQAVASRARITKCAEDKLIHIYLNSSKEGFDNCVDQVCLIPGAPSREAIKSMTSFLKVAWDGAIVDPDDTAEPDLSLEVSDLSARLEGETPK